MPNRKRTRLQGRAPTRAAAKRVRVKSRWRSNHLLRERTPLRISRKKISLHKSSLSRARPSAWAEEKRPPQKAAATKHLVRRRLLRGRRDKFCIVNTNVLLQLRYLNGEAIAGARQGPAERQLDAIGFAVVRVVDLRGIAAYR